MGTKKVIMDTGRQVVYVYKDAVSIQVCSREYPLYPYGNYVESVIELDLDKMRLTGYTVRESWYGTGREDWGYVDLSLSLIHI